MTSLLFSRPARLALAGAAATIFALLAGCANTPGSSNAAGTHPPASASGSGSGSGSVLGSIFSPASASSAAASTATSPPSGLADGIALYNKGDYNGAIKRLGQSDVVAGPKPTQLAALKYTAFSYCVTSRQNLCRQQFEKALKLDASFDLAPGEYGHPLWGPVFVKAKKAATARG
ncbi:MAG: TssQ family T6SS-associated lipoprotein [Massilia sp.]